MRQVSLFVLLVLLLSGCIMNSRMQSWEGKHKDVLIQQWGPPEREYHHADGRSTLSYSYHWGLGYEGAYRHSTCRMTFTTDPDQIIRTWRHDGC